jgi:NAD(P)-dependent dehydrogenase (short-subunit alcohol dehydrogenase family)
LVLSLTVRAANLPFNNQGEEMNDAAVRPVVIVTGGSRNIGFATAKSLVKRNYRVAILARGAEAVAKAAEELGGDVLPLAVDVTARADIFAAFATVAAHFGRIDGLVNNAGVAHLGKVEHLSEKLVVEQVNLNFLATVFGCQAIIPHLRRAGGGRIVNISSASSKFEVFSHLSIYGATKAAVDRFTDELRHEVRGENVAVTTFIPGDTSRSAGAPWDPEIMAEAYVAWLERGTHFAGAMEASVVGEAVARCFDVPPNVSYDEVILRPVGKFTKEMLPES